MVCLLSLVSQNSCMHSCHVRFGLKQHSASNFLDPVHPLLSIDLQSNIIEEHQIEHIADGRKVPLL
jgi:hypothetical protein